MRRVESKRGMLAKETRSKAGFFLPTSKGDIGHPRHVLRGALAALIPLLEPTLSNCLAGAELHHAQSTPYQTAHKACATPRRSAGLCHLCSLALLPPLKDNGHLMVAAFFSSLLLTEEGRRKSTAYPRRTESPVDRLGKARAADAEPWHETEQRSAASFSSEPE